jgi:hypothetical protein
MFQADQTNLLELNASIEVVRWGIWSIIYGSKAIKVY